MTDRLINANDVIEHAEVNGESPEFVRKLADYIDDAPTVKRVANIEINPEEVAKQIVENTIKKRDADRDCKNCAYSSPYEGIGNGCTTWSCEFISRKEAIKAWKRSKWIPCEERFPTWDDGVACLVSVIADDAPHTVVCMEVPNVKRFYEMNKINAWMPLPEPYEEEQA